MLTNIGHVLKQNFLLLMLNIFNLQKETYFQTIALNLIDYRDNRQTCPPIEKNTLKVIKTEHFAMLVR